MHINHPQSRQNGQMNWLFFPWPSSLSIMIIVMIIAFTNMESESLRFRVPPPKMLHLIHSVCKPYVNAAFNIFRVYLTGPLGIVLFITSPYICLENKSDRTNIFSMVNNLKWFERKTRLSSHMRSVRLLSFRQNSLPQQWDAKYALLCTLSLFSLLSRCSDRTQCRQIKRKTCTFIHSKWLFIRSPYVNVKYIPWTIWIFISSY